MRPRHSLSVVSKSRSRELPDEFHLVVERTDTVLIHVVALESHFGSCVNQETLARVLIKNEEKTTMRFVAKGTCRCYSLAMSFPCGYDCEVEGVECDVECRRLDEHGLTHLRALSP